MGEGTAAGLIPDDKEELYRQQKEARAAWSQIGYLSPSGRHEAAAEWAATFGHLFYWCCGSPVFGGEEAEQYYEGSESWKRGDTGGRVYWYADE